MSAAPSIRYSFRKLTRHDIPKIMPIEREAYPDPWSQGMFRQEVSNKSSHFFVGYEDEQLIMYGGFWLILDEAHLTKVTVCANRRGEGLGRVLMTHLLEEARRLKAQTVRLEVREANFPARRLYRTLGFFDVGIRRGYYTLSKEHAVVMVLHLAED